MIFISTLSHGDIVITPEMIERFWSYVDRSDNPDVCWLWKAHRKAKGYGSFFLRRDQPGRYGKSIYTIASRFAYIVTHGNIDTSLVVRHTCDNPPCCNPNHLIPGTIADNTRDAMERGLWNPSESAVRAARSSKALLANMRRRRLSEKDVAAIIVSRSKGKSVQTIAEEYHIGFASIQRIFDGQGYKTIALVQRLGELHRNGIRFPYAREWREIEDLHPSLQRIIEDATKQL